MEKEYSERLKVLREAVERYKGPRRVIAEKAEIKQSLFSMFMKEQRGLGVDNYLNLMKVLGELGLLPPKDPEATQQRRARMIPLVGEVCAGPGNGSTDLIVWEDWTFNTGYHDLDDGSLVPDEYLSVDIGPHMYEHAMHCSKNHVVAVRVTGDSMAPEYLPGDLLLVERTNDVHALHDTDLVIVDVDGTGNYAFKVFWKGPPMMLAPINTRRHRPFLPDSSTRLFGVAIGVFRLVRAEPPVSKASVKRKKRA